MTFSHLLRYKIDVLYCSAQTTSRINIGCLSLIFFKWYTWYRLLKTKCAASRIEKKIMTVTKQVFSSTPPNYHRLNKVVERNNLFLRTDCVRQHVNELPNMQGKKKRHERTGKLNQNIYTKNKDIFSQVLLQVDWNAVIHCAVLMLIVFCHFPTAYLITRKYLQLHIFFTQCYISV